MRARKRDMGRDSKTEEIFFDNGDTLPARFNVDSKDIKIGKKIGEGIWTVCEAEWLGRKVAVKKFDADSTFGNVKETSREVNRMLHLRHPNVLKLLGFYLTTQKEQVLDCTMIMELMDCDLEAYMGRGPLSNDQVVYIFAEVARGMNHIHSKGCFHRDLKPKNVLLQESIVTGFHVEVKIADFGSSELMGVGDINRTAGTIGYKAPEQFDIAGAEERSELFPDKVDVFGFGALCFKLLTGEEPYKSARNVREVIRQLDRAALSQRNLPEDVVEMIWECLDVDPKSRPNFEKISCILDCALSVIREKMVRPLAASTSVALHSKESMLKGDQGHDHLESILHMMGLLKKHAVHFIPFEELLVIGAIGAGSVANVYKVEWKGVLYAQKIFAGSSPMNLSDLGENYFQTFPKLCHQNIVTFMGYSVTSDNRVSIIMELQEGDLSAAIERANKTRRKPLWTIPTRLKIMREIAEGMKYLHDQGVVHGDVKPNNVVVSALDTNDMVVKLIDFANDGSGCTTRYAAPERLQNRSSRFTDDAEKKADVFSFGILCQELLGGAPLLQDYIPKKYIEAIIRGERPPIPIGTNPELECLIQSCWNVDPLERPDFSEVCEWLSQIARCHSCQGHAYSERPVLRCWFL